MTPRTNPPTQSGNVHSKADAVWSDKEVAEFTAAVREVAGPPAALPEITPGQAPDLGQLLHTKANDNCPVCRLRQGPPGGAGEL